MKRTLSLIALAAALLAPTTLGSTTTISVTGVVINANDLSKSTGWYDAEKDRGANGWDDSNLCWAAACSNLVAWWQNQQEYEIEAPTNLDEIWNQYRQTWANVGGHANLGLYWWLDGSYSKNGKTIPARDNGLSPDLGGYYSDYLVSSPGFSQKVLDSDLKVLEIDRYSSASTLSETLVSYISNGYGVELTWALGSSSSGHSVTLWGVEYDETQSVITHFYLTDSDHNANTLTKAPVEITTIESDGHLYETLARRDEYGKLYYKAWSFTVLNSRLGNDVHYLNYVDNSDNVVLKQMVDAAGYKLPEETENINNIVYDGSRGSVDRQLTVDAAHNGLHVEEIQAAPTSGTNLLEVMEGVTLTARDVTGPGTLVKTGKGTLEIGNSQTSIEVRGGSLVSGGTLSDIVVNGGGLEGSGTFENINVQQGTLAVGGEKPGSVTVKDTLTLSHANLEFFVGGWEKKASANDDWESGTYSWIDMGWGQRFSVTSNDGIDSIVIHVGGDALDALSTTGGFMLDLINEFRSFDFLDSYLAGMKEHTTILVTDDEDALAGTGWQAGQDITNLINFAYNFNNGSSWYGPSAIQMVGAFTGVTPPASVPEPATGTLSLLALAGLCARRRRK